LDDSPRGSHILAREPDRGRSLRRHSSVSSVCKDPCTLSWGARTPGSTTGAALASLAVALLIFLTSSPPATASAQTQAKARPSCAYANLRPTAVDTASVDRATLCLIDQLRAAYRLRPLRSNRELQAIAGEQATGMVRDDYFGDDSPSGQTPATLIAALPYGAHVSSLATAQDLGWGTRSAATPAGIVTAWMHSPPHREVILTGAFRDIGIGVSPAVPSILGHGARGATYAVEFAARS
jgi:uncharacterized protein YkwD